MAQETDINKLTEKLHISQGLPENISTEAQLWDVILKKEVFFLPEQLFPLIYEIYGKFYEKHIPVKYLATEYPIDHMRTQKFLPSGQMWLYRRILMIFSTLNVRAKKT